MTDLQKATAKAIVNIFESGRVRGNYGAIAVMKGDSGHLSYGRSQTTLGSGGLATLLDRYCRAAGAKYADQLRPALPRFRAKDFTLDTDTEIKNVLVLAGSDPVMQAAQDQFFEENYFAPAARAAENLGLQTALGKTVVYDSHIQGGWTIVKGKIPAFDPRAGEAQWIDRYLEARKCWLTGCKTPLPATVYRMDAFRTLMTSSNWELKLPIVVRGITLREELLTADALPDTTMKRTLTLIDPWMRGSDVEQLQKQLNSAGFTNTGDGVYGPFTDALVKQYQAAKNIAESGAGPLTRRALGL